VPGRTSQVRVSQPFSLAKLSPMKRETSIAHKPSKRSGYELYGIGMMLERIASHGRKRHPRTPVWSLLTEMARDIQIRSAGWFREEVTSTKKRGRMLAVKRQRIAA
jgi:hypothetical protein